MIASLTIHLSGDFCFSDRKERDSALSEKLAVQCSFLLDNDHIEELNEYLAQNAETSNGRLLLTDCYGKILFDSQNLLNGMLLINRESSMVLFQQQQTAYGIHSLNDKLPVCRYFFPLSDKEVWYSCCAVSLPTEFEKHGSLLYFTSVMDIVERISKHEGKILICVLIALLVGLILSLVCSGFLTRPIIALTKCFKRISGGDFSVRVSEKGTGEIRKLSEAFNGMSEKLETLDQSRNQFVSNASHELKTPLATMKILIENIIYQSDMDSEIRTEFLSDINKEVDRLSLIVSDLLTLVSMDTKAMKLSRTTFSFSQVIQETLHRLKPIINEKQQTLEMNIVDDCDLYADYPKLSQVVYNLTENAVKYTPEGGQIVIGLERSGKDAIFTVQDNGPGIPKEDQPHIFDRFYRVDKARSRATGGTGLGLSIVHQMVMMHGGTISVSSEEGNGSLFTVELPIFQG